jgi:hypothetical protein
MLLGGDEGDDDVRGDEASKMVVVAGLFGWRRCAERQPEVAVLAACTCAIPTAWWCICCVVQERKERG